MTIICHSVDDIYAFVDQARRRLEQRVSDLTPMQQRFKTSPEKWSVAEVVEHLALIEEKLSGMIAMLIKRAAEAQNHYPTVFAPVSLDRFGGLVTERVEAPQMMRPSGLASIHASLAKLRDSRTTLVKLRPEIEMHDLAATAFPHPLFGALNVYEWLLFIGLHEERHRKQIEHVIRARDFPK